MSSDFPIDLPIKTMTSKISVGAHDRLKTLAADHGYLIQDILSACVLHMPEVELVQLLEQQQSMVAMVPKPIRSMMRNLEKMSENDRDMVREFLARK